MIHGQDAALERVASATVAQLGKRHPARPGSVVLLGPTGAGKTATVEALPAALRSLGYEGARVFRLDCGELTDSIQLTRLLGSPPGYSGHAATTPLLTALERPAASCSSTRSRRRIQTCSTCSSACSMPVASASPTGQNVDARHVVVALTTSVESEDLLAELGQHAARRPLGRAARRAPIICATRAFLPISSAASAPSPPLPTSTATDARQGIAESAIVALAAEYGLVVGTVDPVVVEVVEDIAETGGDAAGARALQHAARELLAESFADSPPMARRCG